MRFNRLKVLAIGSGILALSGCVVRREPVVVYRQGPPNVISGPPQVIATPAQAPVVMTAPPPQPVPPGSGVWTNAQPNQGSTPVQPQAEVAYQAPQVVAQAPPPVPVETLPPSPSPDYVWVRGYWTWGEVGWVWAPGRWALPPRARAVWVPGIWIHDGRYHRYRWEPGHWR